MIVRVLKGRDGVAWVYTVESYRDEKGRPRHRTIASHGRLDVLLAADPDALDELRQQAKELTAQRPSRRGRIAYDTSTVSDGTAVVNAGWWLARAVLDRLGVVRMVRTASRRAGWDIDVASIVSLLVCSRVVWPCSKKATVELARDLGALPAMAYTHTCYNGERPPCGSCPACKLRARGFAEAGIEDPLLSAS